MKKTIEQLVQESKKAGISYFSTGGLITQGEQVLLLRRLPTDSLAGHYEIPGGRVEKGESIEEGLRREVLEETGWEMREVLSFLGTFDYFNSKKKPIRQFNFHIAVDTSPALKLTEHDDFLWATPKEAFGLLISQEMQALLKAFWKS